MRNKHRNLLNAMLRNPNTRDMVVNAKALLELGQRPVAVAVLKVAAEMHANDRFGGSMRQMHTEFAK